MKFWNSLILLLGVVSFASAQVPPHCGTDEYTEILINNNPEIAEKYAQTEAMLRQSAENKSQKKSTTAVVYKVPVVVHVIHNSPYDNISRAQIVDGLRVLNEDFRRTNADQVNTRSMFLPVAADVEVEFELATRDPDSNCTDGINRVQSYQSVNARDNVKHLVQWDRTSYLNIWVVNSINSSQSSGTILGYAYRPFGGQTYQKDGIVIRHDRVGTIGTGNSEGRTLTHEVGHYLGLLHPFTDGCFQGDQIADTPPVANSSFGCNLGKNSCGNDSPDLPDMIENFMDYADSHCQNVFTQGQKNYMRSTLELQQLRKPLRTQSNLVATGLASPAVCQPEALISSDRQSACPDDAIQFTSTSEGGAPDTYKWYFPGGQPNTSTSQNPSVTYSSAGRYNVSLVLSNSVGSDSIVMEDYVTIRPEWTSYNSTWQEGFETALSIPEVSVNSQLDTIGFEVTTQAANTGSQSLFLDNFNASAPGDVDEFISPKIFTIFGSGLLLHFEYAFAVRNSENSDELRVLASTDCGQTWEQRRLFAGNLLHTVTNPVTEPFIPTANDWRSGIVPMGAYDDGEPILIKFEFRNGGGNNFYIDNINLTANNISLDEVELSQRLSIFPNPTGGDLHIAFEGGAPSDVEASLTDLYGKRVHSFAISKGETQVSLSTDQFAAGVYFLNIKEGEHSHTEKVILK